VKTPVAILGSGNIGTDLMLKLRHRSPLLACAALAGIDPASPGLARARSEDIETTHRGIEGLLALDCFESVRIVFDATTAAAHRHHDEVLRRHGKRIIDLTPAAIGPYVVPVVNLDAHLEAPNINNVTCGGQATIPMVHAVSRVVPVDYAEVVCTVASRSAGPGTRQNIDEFTRTTARALEVIGGAARAKAIIILNPAEPPLHMRNTIFTLSRPAAEAEIASSVAAMVTELQTYVPGYRLKQAVQFHRHETGQLQTSIFVCLEGAGDHLQRYAGNLDVMTSAARKTAERLVVKGLA